MSRNSKVLVLINKLNYDLLNNLILYGLKQRSHTLVNSNKTINRNVIKLVFISNVRDDPQLLPHQIFA